MEAGSKMIEGQSKFLSFYTMFQWRKLKSISLYVIIFVIFLFMIPFYTKGYYNSVLYDAEHDIPISEANDIFPNSSNSNSNNSTNSNDSKMGSKCPTHYKVLLFISSEVNNDERRMILREELFGITDNLIPCMKQDTEIFYKFFLNKKNLNDGEKRRLEAEQMEYDDVIEIVRHNDDDWQQSLLKFSQLISKGPCATFDHLILIDDYTMINLEKFQNQISSLSTANRSISDPQKLVWGTFGSNLTDNMATIIGSKAVQTILKHPDLKANGYSSIVSRFYHYHSNHLNQKIPDDLILIKDPVSIVEWPNSIKSIPCVDCVIAIGHIYQGWEVRKIKRQLNITTILPCKARSDLEMYSKDTSKSRPSIAVMTSSSLFDGCMIEAAPVSARNKREYAERHGYAFVSRSSEFNQQTYRKRARVWGKIDAVEKVLPYYEWIIWLDMDAIFVNRSYPIEQLLKECEERVGGRKAFQKINLIVARPVGDDMINAGVFLLRNTEWARDFIRAGVQSRRDRAFRGMKEQQAMRDAIKKPQWKPNVLYLDGDDHTINTFPDRYVPGDYIIHYAPEEHCPAKPVLRGLAKVKLLEDFPDSEISMPF